METVETNLPESQPEPEPTVTTAAIGIRPFRFPILTCSNIPPNHCKLDFEVVKISTPPPPPPLPPPRMLDSPWIISIREKLDQARQYESSSPWATQSIYRVPKSLRDVDDTAYAPQIVSLGPYHRGRRRLRDMDRHKWRALHHALVRAGHDVRLYLDAARSLEERARACYQAPLSITADAFVESLVLDSIFVLELLRGVAGEGFRKLGYITKDPVFGNRCICTTLQEDMIKLENQLPLFVLDRILALQLGDESSTLASYLAFEFFENLRLTVTDEPPHSDPDPLSDAGSSKALHCLDVFRSSLLLAGPKPASRPPPVDDQRCSLFIGRMALRCLDVLRSSLPLAGPKPASSPRPVDDQRCSLFIGSRKALRCLDVFRRSLPLAGLKLACRPRTVDDQRQLRLVHCVSELREAGIKFRRRKSAMFWDIKFEDGVLHIPHIFIQDATKSIFRNLIAFEQYHLEDNSVSGHITSYVVFMDSLINSKLDVRYLHDSGIIEHFLGSDREVADLFNQLCKRVAFDFEYSYLSELTKQVNCYCDRRWNAWRASLTHKYFSNPWSIISLVAAVILLLLTFAQTFYAIYGYHKPK